MMNLVERLRMKPVMPNEPAEAADRIEELEAKLKIAVDALDEIKRWTSTFCAADHPIIIFSDNALNKIWVSVFCD